MVTDTSKWRQLSRPREVAEGISCGALLPLEARQRIALAPIAVTDTKGLGLLPTLSVCSILPGFRPFSVYSGCTSAACHPLGPFTTLNCTA